MLLPAWPDPPAPALLGDAAAWVRRVGRRRELLSGPFHFVTGDGGRPHGQPVPRAEVARDY